MHTIIPDPQPPADMPLGDVMELNARRTAAAAVLADYKAALASAPVTNKVFTRTLAETLNRPALFPMPAFAARLIFGQMADELLLASQRVEPARLTASGYRFQYMELAPALDQLLHPASDQR